MWRDGTNQGICMHLAYAQDARKKTSQSLGITSNPDEVISALKLVYHAYVRKGLVKANPHGVRVTPFHLLPTSEVLITRHGREVASTLTLVCDGKLGLPMESVFEDEVASRREQGIVCAEVTCLADRSASRRESFPLLVRLMNFTIQCAALRGVEELMIAIHPRHARFYQKLWGAKIVSEFEQKYAAVCDNPAIALSLNIKDVQRSDSLARRRIFAQTFSRKQFLRNPMPSTLFQKLSAMLSTMVDETTLPVNWLEERRQEQEVLSHWLSVA